MALVSLYVFNRVLSLLPCSGNDETCSLIVRDGRTEMRGIGMSFYIRNDIHCMLYDEVIRCIIYRAMIGKEVTKTRLHFCI